MIYKAIIIDPNGEVLKDRSADILGELQLWSAINLDGTPNIAIIWDTITKDIIEIVKATADFFEWLDPKELPVAYELIEALNS